MAEDFPPLFLCEEGMTINSQTNKVIYTGNGVATEFAIPFSFLERDHIKGRQKLGDIQTERDDWEIRGGNLVFQTAPETGAEIAVIREVPLTQETDYRENEILPAETLERDFDKLTMQVQQLKEQIDRAVTVDVFDDTQAASLIPSIRQAVSDCQTAVQTTAANAQTATERASAASTSAANAATAETNAAAMLGTKADIDLNNLTTAGKEKIASLSVPDYSTGIDFSNGSQITPAYNCAVFCVVKHSAYNSAGIIKIEIGNETFNIDGTAAGHICIPLFFTVSKGMTFSVTTLNSENVKLRYYKLIGG